MVRFLFALNNISLCYDTSTYVVFVNNCSRVAIICTVLKVLSLTIEKRGRLTVELFDRSCFKLFTEIFKQICSVFIL
jgi:hypothetical protein